ncbi:MAG: hypothetical protein ACR2PB_03230, partial [Desulfocapsaceae bacterium]
MVSFGNLEKVSDIEDRKELFSQTTIRVVFLRFSFAEKNFGAASGTSSAAAETIFLAEKSFFHQEKFCHEATCSNQ